MLHQLVTYLQNLAVGETNLVHEDSLSNFEEDKSL